MARSRRHAAPDPTVSRTEVARAIGKTPGQTQDLLQRTGLHRRYAHLKVGKPPQYDQRVIDVLHAVLEQPHRPLEGPEADWLSQWLQRGGDAHAP